jgi:hypothetical protein
MTLDVRPAGSSFQVLRHEWQQPKSGLFARLLGRPEARQQVERIDFRAKIKKGPDESGPFLIWLRG